MARPKPALILSDDERQKLTTWAGRPKSTQRLALRARIVRACADGGRAHAEPGGHRGVAGLVGTWRGRFVAVFRIDAGTRKLAPTGEPVVHPSPSWIMPLPRRESVTVAVLARPRAAASMTEHPATRSPL